MCQCDYALHVHTPFHEAYISSQKSHDGHKCTGKFTVQLLSCIVSIMILFSALVISHTNHCTHTLTFILDGGPAAGYVSHVQVCVVLPYTAAVHLEISVLLNITTDDLAING